MTSLEPELNYNIGLSGCVEGQWMNGSIQLRWPLLTGAQHHLLFSLILSLETRGSSDMGKYLKRPMVGSSRRLEVAFFPV